MQSRTFSTLAGLALTSLVISIPSTNVQAQAGGGVIPVEMPSRVSSSWPDFAVVSVGKGFDTGPKATLRYGSCTSFVGAVTNNYGANYTYGQQLTERLQRVTGGQVLVRFELHKNNRFVAGKNQFINNWPSGDVKVLREGFNFQQPGTYRVTARIIPCKRGSSTTRCQTIPEQNTRNNASSINLDVTSAC